MGKGYMCVFVLYKCSHVYRSLLPPGAYVCMWFMSKIFLIARCRPFQYLLMMKRGSSTVQKLRVNHVFVNKLILWMHKLKKGAMCYNRFILFQIMKYSYSSREHDKMYLIFSTVNKKIYDQLVTVNMFYVGKIKKTINKYFQYFK